jgi:hypothetical protein
MCARPEDGDATWETSYQNRSLSTTNVIICSVGMLLGSALWNVLPLALRGGLRLEPQLTELKCSQ